MNYSRSESIDSLIQALAAAQSVMQMATKDATNPHFGSRYADLASCFEACKKVLTTNGLAILQPASAVGPAVTVTTILAHITGQWIASELTIVSEKPTAQGLGSAISYARRYGLSSMIGLAAEDDDGNAAEDIKGKAKKAQQEVVDRKLGNAQPAEAGQPQAVTAKNFKMLEEFAAMKKALGQELYYGVLQAHGFHKSNEILERPVAVKVYKAMGAVKKLVDAASHGDILPGVDAQFFHALPDATRAAVFVEIRSKLAAACGDDNALEEYEDARRECVGKGQWDLLLALQRKLKYYEEEQPTAV